MSSIPTYREYIEKHSLEYDNQEAKKEYRRLYQREYQRRRRKERKEVVLRFDHNDHIRIQSEANQHDLSKPTFIQKAVLAYLDKQYIVPKETLISQLEQLLSLCYTEILRIADHFTRANTGVLIRHILHCIERLEKDVARVFRNPQTLEEIIEDTLRERPYYYQKLLTLLKQHDHKGKGN